MSERKAGWYWVKYLDDSDWVPGYYNAPTGHWPEACSAIMDWEPAVIGPRIPTPDELSQWILDNDEGDADPLDIEKFKLRR